MEKYLIKSKPIKEESSETNNSGTQHHPKQVRVELNLYNLYSNPNFTKKKKFGV